MKSFLADTPAYRILRFVLGGLFILAGVLKLADPYGFAVTINIYGLTTWKVSNFLSYAIPIVEVVTGLGLVLDVRGALALIVAQLLVFSGILVYAWHIGLGADCGCFGMPNPSENDPTGPLEALLRDVVMLFGCAVIYWQRKAGGHTPRSIPFSRPQ